MDTTTTATRGRRSATPAINQIGAVWQAATVRQVLQESSEAKTFWLDLPERLPFYPGQHLEVRLTAADGYQAARSYSIASSPLEPGLAITVQMLKDGEVSGYLDTFVRPGDELELHYPIGYHFIWDNAASDPVLLIAGGTGVVPLAAMLRHHHQAAAKTPMHLLYSARSLDVVLYKDWLLEPILSQDGRNVKITLTDQTPDNWAGYTRRIDGAMIEEAAVGLDPAKLRVYICGPTPMVEAVSTLVLRTLKLDPQQVKTERFGPTGH